MNQLHKRLAKNQVEVILRSYDLGVIGLREALNSLDIGRSRFFLLLKQYRDNPDSFSLRYARSKPNHTIGRSLDKHILAELEAEKTLIEDKSIPIKKYNYSAIRDNITDKYGMKVSLPTIIARAKNNGYYLGKKPRKSHDREVITNFTGELIQHDSSHHRWSPYGSNYHYLITSIDDHSRLMLYADLLEKETTWKHISALQKIVLKYGCPMRWYTDQHSIFRFVQSRDKFSLWKNFTKFTDDADTQFNQVLKDLNITPVYALSPQAKGKVERPYQWIQDRIVRTAAKERITKLEELKEILKQLVWKYNNQWVHSTTKEIPIIRYEKALRENQSLFKPFEIPKPYTDLKDIFCIRIQRMVNNYRRVAIAGEEFPVPNGSPGWDVDLRITPDFPNKLAVIRFWQEDNFLGEQKVRMNKLKSVQF